MKKMLRPKADVTLLSTTAKAEPEVFDGGVRWKHVPQHGPLAYLHVLFDGLDDQTLKEAQERYRPFAAPDRLDRLRWFNGAFLFFDGISLNGVPPYPAGDLGPPISLDYGNFVERPPGLAKTDFAIGGMAGLNIAPALVEAHDGSLRLVHPDTGEVGDTWPNLDAFLETELRRLSGLHDGAGNLICSYEDRLPPVARRWDHN